MKPVLIIGTGGIGKRHIRGFLKTGRTELHVVEPDAAKREEVLSAYPVKAGFADIRETDLAHYAAAVIGAPAHVHIPLGQACADAGLPFLLEKPLAVTLDGVDRLVETVRRRKLVVRVAYVRRAGRETIELHRQLKAGRIGEVKTCWINASQEFPKYRPDYQKTYYAKKAMGGGAILDAASHMIDLLIWVLGDVSEVTAMYDRLVLQGVEAEDTAVISLRFRSGAIAQINMNQFQKPNESIINFAGLKGNLALEFSKLKFADNDSGQWEITDYMAGLDPMAAHEARFALQAAMFLDAVEGKPCHLTTLDEARANLRVALAAKESYETKRIISLM